MPGEGQQKVSSFSPFEKYLFEEPCLIHPLRSPQSVRADGKNCLGKNTLIPFPSTESPLRVEMVA